MSNLFSATLISFQISDDGQKYENKAKDVRKQNDINFTVTVIFGPDKEISHLMQKSETSQIIAAILVATYL